MADKLQISWDDLNDKAVDDKLAELDAISTTQLHYEQTQIAVPKATRRLGFLYNTIVYLSLFGALGGLLGWAFGEVVYFRPDQQTEAVSLIADYEDAVRRLSKTEASPEAIAERTATLRTEGERNPYFAIHVHPDWTDEQKAAATDRELEKERARSFIAAMLFYGISGVTIAMFLAMADSVIDRNFSGAIIYGSIGAVVGLVGGIVVALVVTRIQSELAPPGELPGMRARVLAQVVCWGLLGLFLAATPGLVLRNGKRLLIGMLGGLIGGVIGGLVYVPVQQALGNEHVSRLIAIVLIGLIAGLACGIIENVVKAGWLKVESGLISGKQFVLYRNPTFIGAHPMSHIYLFNDTLVGRRHACIHIVGSAYEIEDLPLGTRTYVNNRAVSRQRLHNGDEIRVGKTLFRFAERAKTA